MNEAQTRKILSEVALGNIAPDTVFLNGTVFNVFTNEFIPGQSVWIKDGRIAYVGPDQDFPTSEQTYVIDVDRMVLLPGLIDAHAHLANTRSGADEFVKCVIPGGTTTVVTETSELGLVTGKDGVKCQVRSFEGQPIRLFYTVPPLCGLTPAEERNVFRTEDYLPFLDDPNCLGIGELFWSNFFTEGRQGERLAELASAARAFGKQIEGHTAGASGRKLQAYSCFGISSCHEPITEDEVMERLRLGYWVMVREGSIRKELRRVKPLFDRKIDFRRVVLSTDGIDPIDLLDAGYLEASVRTALEMGVPPGLTYQMVTLNAAEHFHLDQSLGSLSPGRFADLLLIPSPGEFRPKLVMCRGKIIYRDGRILADTKRPYFPDELFHTVRIGDITIPSLPSRGKVRAIDQVTQLVTKETIIDLADPNEMKDVIMVLALDRLGYDGAFMGFHKGLGLRRGAFGSTACWDTGDMVVLGCDTISMETVVQRMKEISGGIVFAIGKEIVSEFQAPVGGVFSLKPMEVIRDELKDMEEALRRNGVALEKPLLTIDTLTTAAIPHLRINHNGYVRLKDRKLLSVEVDK